MRLLRLVITLVLVAGPWGPVIANARAAAPTIAVLDTRVPSEWGPDAARTAEELVATVLKDSGTFRPVNRADLAALLGLEQQRQILGGEASPNVPAPSAALGVDFLAVLDVGVLGGASIATLKILDVHRATIIARVQEPLVPGEALAGAISKLVLAATVEAKSSLPKSASDQRSESVARAWEAALQADRDGLWSQPRFEAIVALDATFAPALLWLALAVRQEHVTEGRDYYQRAVLHRAKLPAEDVVLLEAVAPYFAEPFDPAALETSLLAAAKRSPTDARLLLQLGRVRHLQKRHVDALKAYREALRVDPGRSEARWLESLALSHMGRFDEAVAAVDQCLREAPFATHCLGEHARLAEAAGRWSQAEADARRLVAMDASDTSGLRALARARAGLRQPVELVRAVFERAWQAKPEEVAARFWNEVWLDQYAGRYDLAEQRLLGGLEERLRSGDLHRIVSVSASLFDLYLETGQKRAALRLADRIEPQVESGTENALGWTRDGARLLLAAVRAACGGLPRSDYLARWRSAMARVPADNAVLRRSTILFLSMRAPLTRDEAREVLDRMGWSASDVRTWPTTPAADRDLGLLLARAERYAEAIPLLESGTRAWVALGDELRLEPFLMLARSYEAVGDIDAARSAYAELVTRFGAQRPPSISVLDARQRLSRLKSRPVK